MISLANIYFTHEVSRDEIIGDAIKGKITLSYQDNGKWITVTPDELKQLPHPEEPLRHQDKAFAGAHLKRLWRIAKGLHINEQELHFYLVRKNNIKMSIGELLALADGVDLRSDLDPQDRTFIKRHISILQKQYPKAIGLCAQILFTAPELDNNQTIKWKKFTKKEIETMAKDKGLTREIGREIHNQLPELMKKTKGK